LWERALDQDSAERKWPGGVARTSYEAYGLIKEYGIRLPDEIYLTEEAKALKTWMSSYSAEIRSLGCLDNADVLHKVKGLITKGAPVPKEVVLAGFDETSPAVSSIIVALKSKGTNVCFWPGKNFGAAAKEVSVLAFADEREEVIQAARWARATIAPGMTIGFIAPGLEGYRDIILKEFSAELNPASVLPGEEAREVFNISLGRPLSDEPLVSIAIDMLSINEGEIELGKLFSILRSPYFSVGNRVEVAKLDFRLKKENRTAINLWELKRLLRDHAFEKRLDAWTRWLKDSGRKELPSAWARSFTGLLKEAGLRISRRHGALEDIEFVFVHVDRGEGARLVLVVREMELVAFDEVDVVPQQVRHLRVSLHELPRRVDERAGQVRFPVPRAC